MRSKRAEWPRIRVLTWMASLSNVAGNGRACRLYLDELEAMLVDRSPAAPK